MKQYIVEINTADSVCLYEHGVPSSPEEYLRVIELLKNGYRQQKARTLLSSMDEIVRNGQIVFPKQRRDMFTSGDCVYFIQTESMPGVIKIGFTQSLTTRTRAFRHEYGAPITVVAFIKTIDHKNLEKAFHVYFADYRHEDSEWFDETPVLEFLKGLAK